MENLAMDNTSSVLLPYILRMLSQKPELCDTYENLCEEIKYTLSTENHKGHHENIERNIQNALDVGKNLGILVITNDLVRMPFKYNKASKRPSGPSTLRKTLTKQRSTLKKALQKADQSPQQEFFTQPRRTHTIRPTLIPHGHQRRSVRGRKSIRSSSRNRGRSRSGRRFF